MTISHLEHGSASIRCVNCGHEFEVSRHDLNDPYRLVAKKQRIAATHETRCKPKRPERTGIIRAWRHKANGDIHGYFEQAVRELIPAGGFSA
jgi:hypothetical protein